MTNNRRLHLVIISTVCVSMRRLVSHELFDLSCAHLAGYNSVKLAGSSVVLDRA